MTQDKPVLENWKSKIRAVGERFNVIVPGTNEQTIKFAIEQFIAIGNESIAGHKSFAVALSGGSTPEAIYKGLASPEYRDKLDWKRVLLFWSDERNVAPDHADSNYRMAMEAGLGSLGIPPERIFRMEAESDIEAAAEDYDKILMSKLPHKRFDLVMLGMGDDGHTASLFPRTHGLHAKNRLVTANFIPQKNTWRMTLTFECINEAKHINVYVLGKNKADMINKVLKGAYNPDNLPAQHLGTQSNRSLWILDSEAASKL